jgi:RND family efflux transporter MFP subunit
MTTETAKPDLSSLRIGHELKNQESRPTRKKGLIITLLVIALAVVGYFALTNLLAGSIEVETVTVSLTYPSQASAVLTASGYVVARQKASVASKGTGRLVFLGVEEGDRVKKGQVIARLEDQDVIAALDKTRADLAYAKADIEDARQTLERTRTLFSSGLVSQADLDAAEARYRRVEAAIKSAEAGVAAAAVAVENTRIRAPFDGTVLTKDADVGEVVAPFAAATSSRGAVVTLADMSSLEVEADVSESNITRVSPGQPCEIVLDAYPESRYQGFVHKIVPTADRAKATVLTKVRFKERDDRVLPEMSAKVTFLSASTKAAAASAPPILTVPATSIVKTDNGDAVYVVRGDEAVRVRVTTGETVGARIEVKEGLQQGDNVVVRSYPGLTDGSKIRVK